ncbi:ester cyclase [Wenjunlia tyrosinilytica]|jgi:predicted ester cyclase|uniref:Ester cyclase n=1 Tax=Wenjunlia tyrosinilytica TaxID=1544741 RepID=A0A918DYH3_9ACTN|nr:ester cyclase [Wenjunlia tyrosinilytica]GGO92066.1 hypothetical protein GCM10012280_41400 [Wenjunlia tyrosinilytica]
MVKTRAAAAALVAAAFLGVGVTAASGHESTSAPRDGAAAGRTGWEWQLVDHSPGVVQPKSLTVDRSIGEHRARRTVRAAQYFDTFWNTGDKTYLDRAISPDFTDLTLPPGRPQGPEGPVFASRAFRAAVPDLSVEITELIVGRDKVTTRLHLHGHFTGTFQGVEGKGQVVDFPAIDVLTVADGRISTNAHLEDNLTFLKQLGIVKD